MATLPDGSEFPADLIPESGPSVDVIAHDFREGVRVRGVANLCK
tara:strand:+ start:1433 stop:1564 length:132 start_codon:yes stop_codon:yes gene_type:complete